MWHPLQFVSLIVTLLPRKIHRHPQIRGTNKLQYDFSEKTIKDQRFSTFHQKGRLWNTYLDAPSEKYMLFSFSTVMSAVATHAILGLVLQNNTSAPIGTASKPGVC